MTIDNSGKILIGDSASHTDDLLQIETHASGGGHGIQIRRNDSNTDQGVGSITFGNNTATDLASISAKTDGATDNGALLFNTSVSGGANTERMRIDSSGTVKVGLIGMQSPALFSARNNGANIEFGHANTSSGYFGTLGTSANNGRPYLGFSAHADGGTVNTFTTHGFKGNVIQSDNSGNLGFFQLTDADASGQSLETRMTLDASGNLLVGVTTFASADGGHLLAPSGTRSSSRTVTTAAYHNLFYNANGIVGGISTSGSATTYATSSDQRLKENIADADDAGSKIDSIQVRKYDWKADGSHQDYGMIAQELLEVALKQYHKARLKTT